MPRDVNGVYTLPAGNPVIPNTIIATNWANTTMDDIAAALTASLSIDGSVTTNKLANSAVTTVKIANNAVTLAKLSTDVQNGVITPNVLVNSSLQFWQAATSLGSGTGARDAADMFRHNSAGTTYTVAQTGWPNGFVNPIGQGDFYMRVVTSTVAGASNFCIVSIPVENVNTLSGTQVTLSMWCRTLVGQNIAIEFQQEFGTGGSPSAAVSTPAGLVAVPATNFTRMSVTVTLPTTAGKTLGSNNDDCLRIVIWLDAGSSFNTRASNLGQQSGTFDFWGFKLEPGSAASTYEVPDRATEYLKCLRYFQKLPAAGGGVGTIMFSSNVTSGNLYQTVYAYPVRTRGIPSVVYTDGASVNFPAAGTVSSNTPDFTRITKTASGTGLGLFTGVVEIDSRL